jgi:hypothetical protein
MDISMIATLLKRAVAVCLAFVIFWHVTPHAAPRRGKAIVHLSQPDVLVFVDHVEYHVRSVADSPIVCDLEPGDHRLQVWRHGALLDEERFVVESGKDVVVSALAHADVATENATASRRPESAAEAIRPAGLAARIPQPQPTSVPN